MSSSGRTTLETIDTLESGRRAVNSHNKSYSILNRLIAGNKTEGEPLMDFANGEILFQCLRLIGSGLELGRLLIAAERQGLVQVLPSAISGPQA